MAFRYIEDNVRTDVSFGADDSFGEFDWDIILGTITESHESAMFVIGPGGSIMTSPALNDGIAYFGASDSRFYAVEMKTGKEVWHFDTDDVIFSSPVIQNGAIYFGCNDRGLYALDMEGKLLWKFAASDRICAGVAACNSCVCAGSADGTLYFVDHNGRLLWKFSSQGHITNGVVIAGDKVVFGSHDRNLYCISLKDGKLIWRFPTGDIVDCEFSISEGVVYFGSYDNKAYAVSLEDGRRLWDFPVVNAVRNLSVYRDMVFVAAREGSFYCLSREGKLLWKFSATKDFSSRPPCIRSGVVYVPCHDGVLYALSIKDGSLVWKYNAGGNPLVSGPAIDEKLGLMCFGSWDCNLHCVRISDGSLAWKFHTSLAFMSPVEVEKLGSNPIQHTVVWEPEDESGSKSGSESDHKDYGEFSGSYMAKDRADYASSSKRGYIRKKEF